MSLLHTYLEPCKPGCKELELDFFWQTVDATKQIDPEQKQWWPDVVHDSVGLVCMGGEL